MSKSTPGPWEVRTKPAGETYIYAKIHEYKNPVPIFDCPRIPIHFSINEKGEGFGAVTYSTLAIASSASIISIITARPSPL